jgi:cation/acetate symporter
MAQLLAGLDPRSLLPILALWLVVVLLAGKVMDWLFPRITRRDKNESGEPDLPTEPLPWYPIAPRIKAVASPIPQTSAASKSNPAYWRANLRIIIAMLIMWLGAAVLPVALAPWLNQVQILTGFPLGYYMSGQGSLIIFLGIITAYVLRMGKLERRFHTEPSPAPNPSQNKRLWRIGRNYATFTLGFLGLIGLMSALETPNDSPMGVGWLLLVVSIGLYAVMGLQLRARSVDDYFVAERNIPAFFNGLAIAGDWMSAASFISMAGTLWLLGYEGLAYILGWTGGYVVLAVLLAPYLRKFGQLTIPDFVAARFEGNLARVVAAVIGILISFTYVTAQVSGIGIIMSRFLGVNFIVGVIIGLGSVLFCSVLGGMRAITWTQVAQCIVLLIAYLVPVTMLSLKFTGVPLPQLMYGEALQQIVRLEALNGITSSYITPFNDWSVWNFLALMLCLMLGTTGMPHILIRFYTVGSPQAARKSAGWALAFILLLYLTAPAYAAFSRWEVLQNVVGKPIAQIPEWANNWAQAGLLTLQDLNSDGILQFRELRIDPDLVVLATPEIAGLPRAVAALVAAGGLAAALSTADGLLLVIASALSHDIYGRTINPGLSSRRRLLLGRVAIFAAAILAALTAIRRLGIIVQLVAWAFSLAAATFFPVLVLGIFWKRANGAGAVAGMIAGAAVTLAYMIANFAEPSFNVLGISHVAAGVFGIPVNFGVTILVSKLTAAPSPQAEVLIEELRQP